MKTLRSLQSIPPRGAALLAFALLAPTIWSAHAQENPRPLKLEVATARSEAAGLSKLAGKPIRGTHQEQLGTLSDFLVEPSSGKLRFAVVPSGGGASGETFRLVPISALKTDAGADALTTQLDQPRWDQVGTFTTEQLQGSIALNSDQQQRLSQQFGLGGSDPNGTNGLIKASVLKGREIRAGNDTIGRVEDVVIDLHNKIAAPLVSTAAGFAGSANRFLLPFDKLQMAGDASGTLTTSLNRWDFQQLQPGTSPTGAPPPRTASAAAAVQQALAQNPAFAQSGVQVIPESRLVLRGSVENQQKKAEIERAAQQAAPGMRIDNEITVRNW